MFRPWCASQVYAYVVGAVCGIVSNLNEVRADNAEQNAISSEAPGGTRRSESEAPLWWTMDYYLNLQC